MSPNNSNPEQGAVILAAQQTNISTGVTCHAIRGQITTQAMDAAAAAENEFVVTNRFVTPASVIALGFSSATTGTPLMQAVKMAAGSFTITITNVNAATALNAAAVINFLVL